MNLIPKMIRFAFLYFHSVDDFFLTDLLDSEEF